MPAVKKNIDPPIQVDDKIVQVSSLTWAGLNDLLETLRTLNPPKPNLADEGIRQQLAAIQGATVLTFADILGLIYSFTAANTDVLWQWLVSCPAFIEAILKGSSNLTADDIAKLTAKEVLQIATAIRTQIQEDGLAEEAFGFFGGWLRIILPPGNPASPSAETAPSEPAASSSP